MKGIGSFALAFALGLGVARAADVRIVGVKAFLFWEHSGKFSDDIVDQPAFDNLARGGGPNREAATAVLFDLTFAGEKNATPKYATATVDITQSQLTGQSIVTHKAFTNFVLGEDGLQHKALLVENATCAPLALDVHTAKSEKSVRLDFACPK
jgi:hypothetical protein